MVPRSQSKTSVQTILYLNTVETICNLYLGSVCVLFFVWNAFNHFKFDHYDNERIHINLKKKWNIMCEVATEWWRTDNGCIFLGIILFSSSHFILLVTIITWVVHCFRHIVLAIWIVSNIKHWNQYNKYDMKAILFLYNCIVHIVIVLLLF